MEHSIRLFDQHGSLFLQSHIVLFKLFTPTSFTTVSLLHAVFTPYVNAQAGLYDMKL